MIVFRQQALSDHRPGRVWRHALENPALERRLARARGYLATFLIVSAGCAEPVEPRMPPRPLPQVSGTLIVAGLSAPVRVARDRWGVPHITAGNQADLFFAQGFVQAQDRLFQMDLWRRSVQGRLSEVLGSNFLERDGMTRRIQYRGDLESEWASYGPEAKAIATAFVSGINAWIRIAHDPFPEEFTLAGWAPELWRPEDLLNRTDAFVAGSDAVEEVFRARLVAALGSARASDLLPGRGFLAAPQGLEIKAIRPVVGEILRRVGTPPFLVSLAAPLERSSGSNAWAIARSASGSPLLAGDPHRPFEHPSLRYLVHLQAPGWNVIGATAPWLPGVVIGHNERVAWSMTAASADTQDIYVETLNPANPGQVLQSGRWVDLVIHRDTIIVKGHAKPFEYEYSYSPHGVVFAVDRDRNLAYAVKWSGSEPGAAAELGALGINRARSAAEIRDALRRWKAPAAEFVYTDQDGHLGRQLAALVPVRAGWSGALPVPGQEQRYEWNGWLPFEQLSADVNPKRSFVLSANDSPSRSSRIAEQLAEAPVSSVEGFKRLQQDIVAWNAQQLVPLLANLRAVQSEVDDLRQRLLRWDRRITPDTAEATAYMRWETALLTNLASRRVPTELSAEYVSRARSILVPSLLAPSRRWFDGALTRERDELLLKSLAEAQDMSRGGESPRTVTFAHPLGLNDATRRRFNVGPVATPGYVETVFATTIGRAGPSIGPSLRVILDAGDWDRSVATNPPGQSGSPESPHFRDLAALWAAGEYFPLPFSDRAVEEATEAVLTLVPK
jgi:penicillin amidase